MNKLTGINLIFHSVRQQGGLDRHMLDLINGFSLRKIPLRVIARMVDWDEKPVADNEYVVLPDRTPFSRFNNDRFEKIALGHVNPEWPVISLSRVTGKVDMAISGGTHKAHLKEKGKKVPGFFDRRVIANEEKLYQNARVIIAHSKQIQNEIIEGYSVDPLKVKALYPSVDTAAFNLNARRNRDQIRQSIGVSPDQFVLLFPSNDHERKGGDLILEAIEGFDERLVLAVAGKNPLKVANGAQVKNLGFCKDMPAMYAAADAAILASVYEPFGLVGPESMLCGTPVLLADTIGAVEVLSEPGCFSFERTPESLRSLLETMLERHQENKLVLTEPERFIHYPYSFDAYLDTLVQLLESSESL